MQRLALDEARIAFEDEEVRLHMLIGPPPLPGTDLTGLNGPQGFLVEYSRPGEIKPHFHPVNQFQIVKQGEGTMGKHSITPVSVHYTDAYTPYGPIRWGDTGLQFFNFRMVPDAGAFMMPGSREDMRPNKAGRSLVWDIAPNAILPEGTPEVHEAGFPGQDDGLIGVQYSASAGGTIVGRSARDGGGQVYLVIQGSVTHYGKHLPMWHGLYVAPTDTPPRMAAGPEGAQVIMVQFPAQPGR